MSLIVIREVKFPTFVEFLKCTSVGLIFKKLTMRLIKLIFCQENISLWIRVPTGKYDQLNFETLFSVPTRNFYLKSVLCSI